MDEAENLCDRLVVMDGGPADHPPSTTATTAPITTTTTAAAPGAASQPAGYGFSGSSWPGRPGGGAVPESDMPRPATGRAVGPVRAALIVVEGMWTWYRRNWRATVVSSVVQPVLFLLALGFGLGSQVRPAEATGGLSYVVYLAPALLVATSVQIAAFESTYPILSAFKWQQTYLGIAASPITPAQILGGHLLWVALRLGVSGAAYLLVAAALGTLTSPGVILSLLVSVLAGLAFSAPVAAYSATLQTEGQQFSALFRFVVMPMTLFAGTFFPVDQLPVWVRPVAWLTPLWHGTELSRGAAFGGLSPLAAAGHLAFLLTLLGVGVWFGARSFTRRLAA